MKVADLQDILSHVGQLLAAAGSSKAATELANFRAALDPFRDLTAPDLSKALHKLTEPPPAKPKAAGKAGKMSPEEVEALIRDVKSLYERAGAASTTLEEIEATAKRLEALPKDVLVRVAEGIELVGMKSKSKPAIAAAIRQRIAARKGAGQRVGLVERAGVGGEQNS